MPPPAGLAPYLVLQKATDTQVLKHLSFASVNIDQELARLKKKAGVGAAIRSEQLLRSQAAINAQLSQFWAKIGDTVEAASLKAAAEGVETMMDGTQSLLSQLFSEADRAYMVESARASAQSGLRAVEERLSGTSKIPLSDKVYGSANLTTGKVDRIINDALARGASAAELARDVKAYINPNTAGGVRYASLRLARTEINNAYHAGQVREAQRNPMIEGVKWELSGSHPVPDECNQYAEQEHVTGWEEGVFRPEQVPGKPHPNCLCYTIPVTVDKEEFLKAFEQGQYNTYLEENFPQLPDASPPVDPASPLAGLPRMAPQEYKDGLKIVNPGHDLGEQYKNNCHFVTNAIEMRARGYDVVASQTYKDTGRYMHQVSQDWIDPATGEARPFKFIKPKADSYVNIKTLTEQLTDWEPGARGVIFQSWRSGGGHFYSIYKDSKGAIKLVDGQNSKAGVASYLDRGRNVHVLRLDDLDPLEGRVAGTVTSKLEQITVKSQEAKAREMMDRAWEDWATVNYKEPVLKNNINQLAMDIKKDLDNITLYPDQPFITLKPPAATPPAPVVTAPTPPPWTPPPPPPAPFARLFPELPADARSAYKELGRKRPGGLYAETSEALQWYQGYGFKAMNSYLRGVKYEGTQIPVANVKTGIKGLDADFRKSGIVLDKDTTVLRGLKDLDPALYKEGEFVVEAAYTSTTLDTSIAERFARAQGIAPGEGQGDGWIVEIFLPKNTRALLPDARYTDESELILQRNTKYRVHSVNETTRRVKLELVS